MENKDLEKILNKWFEMKYQTYDNLEHDDSIYLYYEGERYAEIRIDKKTKDIFYDLKFYEEFSDIISIQRNVFDMVMTKWVEDTFGLMGFKPRQVIDWLNLMLKIPLV